MISLPILIFIGGIILRATLWKIYLSPLTGEEHLREFSNSFGKIIYYPTYTRLDGILMGVIIAMLFTFSNHFITTLNRIPNLPLLFGFFFLVLGCWLCSDRTSFLAAVFGFPAFALGYGGLVISAAIPHSVLNYFKIPGSTLMATLAYTFYLTHKELIHLFHPWLKSIHFFQNDNTMLITLFFISITGALLLHLTVEKPFLNLRDKLLKKRKML